MGDIRCRIKRKYSMIEDRGWRMENKHRVRDQDGDELTYRDSVLKIAM